MSWTASELDVLRKAYASGTLRVSFEGCSVEYGSAIDLPGRIRIKENEMRGQPRSSPTTLRSSLAGPGALLEAHRHSF